MAIITSITPQNIPVRDNSSHSKIPAYFIDVDENTIQINTYGLPTRQNPDESSQNIRLDKEAALELARLIHKKFGI